MQLLAGTVTFLFTDIEGSTRLWEQQPDTMRLALAQHDAILRQTIESHGGMVFKTIGDAFCAVFPIADDAAEAAVAVQLNLRNLEPAPAKAGGGLALRVRIALHSGPAEQRDGDYFGPTLNRAARLVATGYGGQVLLSQPVRELLQGRLPAGSSLRDLGGHRLRDLQQPEHVWQLIHPALPDTFPPLRSLNCLLHNLPVQVTSFIGRDAEMAEVKRLLAQTRLLTLTGPGGTGKTRLTLQVAADLLDGESDGVWLVELAPLTDPHLVPQTVAAVLNLGEEPGHSFQETLTSYLKTRRLMIVLDNCEHMVDACARLSDTLLRSCQGVKILASSREALGISGELTYRVPSLGLPDLGHLPPAVSLEQYEAIRLFSERARAHQPAFTVTEANARDLAQVCHRLDGIPLAIELAAARIRSLTVQEINARLHNVFRLLTGGSRTALPRQQTLRALIDWSYDLLNEQERRLFCRFSVFSGGWTLEAAQAVCADPETTGDIQDWEVLDLLGSLIDKSLVVADQGDDGTRYRLLETIRQYCRDRLMESGEGEEVRLRHLENCLELVEQAGRRQDGPEASLWLDRQEAEHDNLRAALDWCLSDTGTTADTAATTEAALKLVSGLWWFWQVRGYLDEGSDRLAAVLAHPGAQAPTILRADALHGAGELARLRGDYLAARAYHEESLSIRREQNDRRGISASHHALGIVAMEQGDGAAARTLFEDGLAAFRLEGDRAGESASLSNLGIVVSTQGDFRAAREFYEEALAIERELDNHWGIAIMCVNLGRVLCKQGDYPLATSCLTECLTFCRQMGERSVSVVALWACGELARDQGDLQRAVVLYSAADTLRRAVGMSLTPTDQEEADRDFAGLRDLVPPRVFDAAVDEGRSLSWEQAIAFALGERTLLAPVVR